MDNLGGVVAFNGIYSYDGWAYPPEEWVGIYAAAVVAGNICTSENICCDPSKAIGPPDAPWGETTTEYHVSLGAEDGYIIAEMAAAFTDGPGPDIRVYELGSLKGGTDEEFDVFISDDSINWILVADDIRNDSGFPFASVDIAPNDGTYLYIKISNEGRPTSTTPGADIDAIQALYPS